ncbi:MAG: hypothetical protein KAS88_03185 [Deltaproteobacteria bacterium]|nr:hypothetical protein [Deltaproteobacteria bacterium]
MNKTILVAISLILLTASKSFAHPASEAEGYRLAEASPLEAILINITHLLTSPLHVLILTAVVVSTCLIIRFKRAKAALNKKK